jgi:uncharacterized protein (DUF1800 family)
MMSQFAMLRDNANGSLRNLLIGIGKDPAMLVYLDNRQNVKGHPNENFAREILELFSLGVGNYTEKDIKEAARAFTGWGLDSNGFAYLDRPSLHDDGEKTFLGKTGAFKGEDIVDIILQQPACSHCIARKLYRFFGREDFSKEFEDKLAASLARNNYEMRPFWSRFSFPRISTVPQPTPLRSRAPCNWWCPLIRSWASAALRPTLILRP